MNIKLNGELEDISAMMVGAERYALGRRTYIVKWTCDFIKDNLHLLTNKDKIVIFKDIKKATYYGDECDKYCWLTLMKILEKELEGK